MFMRSYRDFTGGKTVWMCFNIYPYAMFRQDPVMVLLPRSGLSMWILPCGHFVMAGLGDWIVPRYRSLVMAVSCLTCAALGV